ncbi:MAG: InlB B-repeat-containing protein, partial [Lachnospiraceae bacterium]|nr:InlB B-repeat-containing protein [Lachnospiraceae bacterium]
MKTAKRYSALFISFIMMIVSVLVGASVNVRAGTATISDVPATFNVMKPLTETELDTGTEVFLSYRTNNLKGDLATTIAAIVTVTNEQNTSIDYHHGDYTYTIYVKVTFTNSLETFDNCPEGALVSNDGQTWAYYCWQGGKQNMPILAYITDTATGTLTVTMDDTKLHFNKDSMNQTIEQSDIKSIAYHYNYDGVEKSGTFNDYTIKPDNTTIGTDDPDITVTYDLANSEQVVTLPVDYAVYFDLNGGNAGTGYVASKQYQVATKVTKPGNPSKNGYTFSHWATGNTADSKKWDFDTDKVRGVMTLYAIYKQNQTITAEDISTTYGDTAKASYSLGIDDTEQILSYTVTSGDDVIQIDINGNIITKKAGSATVKITVEENSRHTGAETVFDVTVAKKPITVTANNKTTTYGELEADLDYTVSEDTPFIGNDNEENAFTGSIIRTDADNINAGIYAIKQGTLSSANYEIEFTDGTYEIAPKAITINAEDNSKIYGDSDPELIFSLDEGSEMAYEETLADLNGGLAREQGEDTGIYTIGKGTLENKNYDISFNEGMFTITKRPVTVIAEDKAKVYGDEEPKLTFVIDENTSLADKDTVENAFKGSIKREQGKNAGTYKISRGTLHSKNYDITFKDATFTITKRPITIFAENKAKAYGASDPALTYVVYQKTPLCDGDVLGKAVTIELKRVSGETPGEYKIGSKNITSMNY